MWHNDNNNVLLWRSKTRQKVCLTNDDNELNDDIYPSSKAVSDANEVIGMKDDHNVINDAR